MKKLEQLNWNNRFAQLPSDFHSRVKATPMSSPYLISACTALAEELGLDPAELHTPGFAQWCMGHFELEGTQPVSALYSGHQFGHYNPQLGDGRALLLGEMMGPNGQHWELQLKGAGPTPYSRGADGRAVLRSSIREYLCSEAMHGLGIPTTRALALVGSDEEVYREQIETGATVMRVSPSFVRFGNFEIFYYRDQHAHLKQLADYVIDHDFTDLKDNAQPYHALLKTVVERTAALVAQWQLVGFAHGVLNSDNMSVLGLTLDYGPFGFLDHYNPGFICNHSDHHGRYAFDQQPSIGLWNCSCFAQALLPLLHEDGETAAAQARELLELYEPMLVKTFALGMRAKLGLVKEESVDQQLSSELLELMEKNKADYTNTFRRLSDITLNGGRGKARDSFVDREAFDAWTDKYRERLSLESLDDAARKQAMDAVNPKYVLRNYLAQAAIEKAQQKDFSMVNDLLAVLQSPFDEHTEFAAWAAEPPSWADEISVSCSS